MPWRKAFFHVCVVGRGAHGPGVVGRPGHVDEVERDVVGLVGFVERVEWLGGHVVCDSIFGCRDVAVVVVVARRETRVSSRRPAFGLAM